MRSQPRLTAGIDLTPPPEVAGEHSPLPSEHLTVAAVVPCFNSAATLRATLESLLQQTRKPDEIIIVDDGSTDQSSMVAESYGHPVRVITIVNSGAAVARHVGAAGAASTIIVFMDAGDIAPPRKIEALVDALLANPEAVCSFGVSWNRAKEAPTCSPITGEALDGSLTIITEPFSRILSQSWPMAAVMNIAIRRNVAVVSTKISGYYRAANDYALQLSTARFGSFVHVAEITVEFVTTPGGITTRYGPTRQLAFALLAAEEMYRQIPGGQRKYGAIFKRRVEDDWPPIALGLYLQRDQALLPRIVGIGLRQGLSRRALRHFWWALDIAADEDRLRRRPFLSRAATGARFIRKFMEKVLGKKYQGSSY